MAFARSTHNTLDPRVICRSDTWCSAKVLTPLALAAKLDDHIGVRLAVRVLGSEPVCLQDVHTDLKWNAVRREMTHKRNNWRCCAGVQKMQPHPV